MDAATPAPPPAAPAPSSRVRVKDYRGLRELTPEQLQQLEAAREAASRLLQPATGPASPLLAHPPQQQQQQQHQQPALPVPTARLNSGYDMPLVGLGTWKASPGEVRAAVLAAVRCGYRHIDCASVYGNEHEVGAALQQLFAEGTVARSNMFITTKLWNSDHGDVEAACRRSLAALRLAYVDLYLIHWPVVTGCRGPELQPSTAATWAAMEDLVGQGLARSIGVSNFSERKLCALMDSGALRVRPAVLQVEAHPFHPNAALIAWAQAAGLHVTAYSPLGSPDSAAIMRRGTDARKLMEEPAVLQLARKHGKSPAQVLIRWALERGCSVLPKSTKAERIAANAAVLQWQLEQADVDLLGALPYRRRMVDGNMFLDQQGPYKTLADLWDEDNGAADRD